MIKAIIIDDEKAVVGVIKRMLAKYCTCIEITGTAYSAEEGILEINKENPDLVFLDMKMNEKDGIDLLNNYPSRKFETIIISGHPQYAIETINFNPVHFISKPVTASELIEAVNKAEQIIHEKRLLSSITEKKNVFPNQEKTLKKHTIDINRYINKDNECIKIEDVVFIKASGSYSDIHLNSGKIITISKNTKEVKKIIKNKLIIRTHKSFLINMAYFKKIFKEKKMVELSNGIFIPVSKRKLSYICNCCKNCSKFKILPKSLEMTSLAQSN